MTKTSDTANTPVPGGPQIDPTANVLKLVEKAVERMDDLRANDDKWMERLRTLEMRCADELAGLRDQLRDAESRRIDATGLAESRRIDAQFAEQKAAVALDREKSTAQAAALAQSVVASAEALRSQATAATAATTEAIKVLERTQYQTGGRDMQRGEAKVDVAKYVGWALAAVGLAWAMLKP